MDYYSFFKERFTWGSNPYIAITDCQQVVVEMLDNPKIPFCIAASAAVDLLSALADSTGNGYTVTAAFKSTMQALADMCQKALDTTEAADKAWLLETQELEQEASGGPHIFLMSMRYGRLIWIPEKMTRMTQTRRNQMKMSRENPVECLRPSRNTSAPTVIL